MSYPLTQNQGITESPPLPVPLLPVPAVINTIRVNKTELTSLARAQAFLENVPFLKTEAVGLGISGAFVAIQSDSGAIVIRRLRSLEGSPGAGGVLVFTEGGPGGAVESHPLEAVLEADPTPKQWKEACADMAGRVMRGQLGHIFMRELKSVSEHLARLQRCVDVLVAFRLQCRTVAGGSGGAAAAAATAGARAGSSAAAAAAGAPSGSAGSAPGGSSQDAEQDVRMYDELCHALRAPAMLESTWNGWCRALRTYLWGIESALLLAAQGCRQPPSQQQRYQPKEQHPLLESDPGQAPQRLRGDGCEQLQPQPEFQAQPLPTPPPRTQLQSPGGPGRQQEQQPSQSSPASAWAGDDGARKPAERSVREQSRTRWRGEDPAAMTAAVVTVAAAAAPRMEKERGDDDQGSPDRFPLLPPTSLFGRAIEDILSGRGAEGPCRGSAREPDDAFLRHRRLSRSRSPPRPRSLRPPSPWRRQCAAGSASASAPADDTKGSPQRTPPQPHQRPRSQPRHRSPSRSRACSRSWSSRGRSLSRSRSRSRSPSPRGPSRGSSWEGHDMLRDRNGRGGDGGGGGGRGGGGRGGDGSGGDGGRMLTRTEWSARVLRFLRSQPGGRAELRDLLRQGLAIPPHLLVASGKRPSSYLYDFYHLWTVAKKGTGPGVVLTALANKFTPTEHEEASGGDGSAGLASAEREQQLPGQKRRRWRDREEWEPEREGAGGAACDDGDRNREQGQPGPRGQEGQQRLQSGSSGGDSGAGGGSRNIELPLKGLSSVEAVYLRRLCGFLRTRPDGRVALGDLQRHNLHVPPAVLKGRNITRWAKQHLKLWHLSDTTPATITLLPKYM